MALTFFKGGRCPLKRKKKDIYLDLWEGSAGELRVIKLRPFRRKLLKKEEPEPGHSGDGPRKKEKKQCFAQIVHGMLGGGGRSNSEKKSREKRSPSTAEGERDSFLRGGRALLFPASHDRNIGG